MDRERLRTVKPEERHKIIGGEPSGHMMFGVSENGDMDLIDDPIITQLKILGLMRKTGKDFDTLLKEISGEVEEVFTARKPEAWAGEPEGNGISLAEKIKLELKERGSEKIILTEYAKKFVSQYVEIFSDGYIEAYYRNIAENLNKYSDVENSISFSNEYNGLLNEGKTINSVIEYLNVGKIDIKTAKGKLIEEVEIRLRLTNEDWAGPADINLSFNSKSGKLPQSHGAAASVSGKNFDENTECNRSVEEEKELRLAGGVVSRNSGTSPKNSAYNKLWFEHYPTGHKVGNDIIEKVVTQMAEKRVEFTNRYIEGLRGNA